MCHRFPLLVLLSAFFIVASETPVQGEENPLRGAWRTDTYFLKDGAKLKVDGLIFFTDRDWTVLFFVMDEDRTPQRGSGEGGTYTLQADRLVFTHLYHLSAGKKVASLPETPLRMEVKRSADAAREPCQVEVDEQRMTIHFPSGNRMSFVSSSRF
ncbi:MAG: hypothetical protein ACE5JI_05885 [Acidobacteriota bacterium]